MGSFLVLFNLCFALVRPTIIFNNQPSFGTVEINNIGSNAMLSTEFMAFKLLGA